MDETRQFEDIGKDQTKSAKRNFRKEIAEYRKQIEALELEEAKEKLAPTIDLIRDEILRNQDAVNALSGMPKDEVKVVAKALANCVADIVVQVEPELQNLRDKKARQNEARKARHEAAAMTAQDDVTVDESEDEIPMADDTEGYGTQQNMYSNANQWNGQR